MASASSAPIPLKYDVFLGFRGEDTRNGFTDNLYEALRKARITTFRDDNEIQEGQELKPEIERAITESTASIIVISKNYANSSWCLDELRLILEQKSNAGHIVFQVFYGVDPSDVRNQRGNFKIKAKYIFTRSKWTKDNVNRWKAALTEVANLKGMVVSGYEKDIIAKIVDKVYHQLGFEIHNTPTDLTGIETRAERIISWLRSEQQDHPVLAICGMGGSGKTTLAKHIYYLNKHDFDGCCLLEEIGNQPRDLLGAQNKLLRDVSGNNYMTISDVNEGTLQLLKAIQKNRVLIVVDDIDDKDKLSTLFGMKVFHTQSKIIITTRTLNIDTWFGSISWRCNVHEIELLNLHESLELLSLHAFGSKFPMEDFKELAVELAQYCGGNPLALKVLGSSLPVRAQDDQWTRNNMVEIWRSRMASLNSLKGDLDYEIDCVLRKSFYSLPCDSHRELFLHIACLFIGKYIDEVEIILEKDWHAKSGVPTLINRCLVTKSTDGTELAMHKLLQHMASKIVREESKHLAKRSRIWCKDEAYQLLKKGEGSKTIEGLSVQLGEAELGMTTEEFKTISLVKMKNLKFLQLEYVNLTGTYDDFPELIWFKWHGCNLRTIPPGLLTSYLVALHMTYGDLEEFDPPTVLNSLKILDLSFSKNLVSICNFIQLPKLVQLDLNGCTSLIHVCKTIGDLKSLSYLSLARCTKLWKSNPIFISGKIPEQPLFFLPQPLSRLKLAGNSFEMLPSHIDLKTLMALDLTACSNLKSLPCLPSMLERLGVAWCSSLENITFQSGRFTLQGFSYEGCFKLCEIQGLFKLVSIEKLDETDLGNMQWIKAYQYHKVDLVGDVITKGRTFTTQMLYEYGIRSTFLQGVTDQSMATHDYTSSSGLLSFHVPLHPKKHRIQGLYVAVMYSISSGNQDRNAEPSPLFIRINNRTKDITWVYSPVVYCKPRVDEDAVWLSYWPIDNTLDAGDEVHVDILMEEGMISRSGIGASVVYMDAGDAEKEEEKSKTMKSEEVIGGNLSLFEVKGGFYLCRRDFSYGSMIPARFFGEDIKITDSRRWRASSLTSNFVELNDVQNHNLQDQQRIKVQNIEHLKVPLNDIISGTNNFGQECFIGSGAYGEVYKAVLIMKSEGEVHETPKVVAVKRIMSKEDRSEKFFDEIDALSKCKHPNIISLLGFCIEGNEMLLVYELASNGSLDSYLQNTDKMINLTWAQRLRMCIDIAHGLKYLHTTTGDKKLIIHRDIKSDNILLDENLEVKIADFGLSKFHQANQHDHSTINTNNIAGTNFYMDPEYDRTGRLKKASDIYSFGVVLFEIFTGTLAYDSSHTREHKKGLAGVARRHFQAGTLKNMLDPKTMEEAFELGFTGKVGPANESLKVFLKIAYQCLAKSQAPRPTAEVVLTELKKALNFQENHVKALKISLEDIKLGVCITKGGYRMIYKGTIRYNNKHKKVNIKKFTGEEEEHYFYKEFEVLFKYKQDNIIGLEGYCQEKNTNFIVYEHAPNGSLDMYLNDASFSWTQRLEVCTGIANGLKFLHGGDLRQDVVVHRDLKSSNILLNKNWKAKICGFEHALTNPSITEIENLNNHVVRSPGYCDPLVGEKRILTKESDIYSFGVILFEILCGRLVCPEGCTDRSQFLDVMVVETRVEEIVFEGIKGQIAQESLDTFSTIAFKCLQREGGTRPTASEVVEQLQKSLKFQEDYNGREAEFHKKYKDILKFIKSPKIYSKMVKNYIKGILSMGILLDVDREDLMENFLQPKPVNQEPVQLFQEEDNGDLEGMYLK